MELETERLLLIPLDADGLRLRLQDRNTLERKLGLRPTPEPSYAGDAYDASARAAMARAAERIAREPGAYLWHTFWQIVGKQQRCIVGEQDFHGPPDAHGVVEFGYMMRPERRNRGFATEAARALVAWALAQPGVTAIVAETDWDNLASQRVLQKLGFAVVARTPAVVRWRLGGDEAMARAGVSKRG